MKTPELPNLEMNSITFQEHKEQTALDCEKIAQYLNELAIQIREGNLMAFNKWWIEGGTEEGDAIIESIREMIVLRYLYREDKLSTN